MPLLREDDKLMPYTHGESTRRSGRIMGNDALTQNVPGLNYNFLQREMQTRMGLSAFTARAHPHSPIP